MKSFLPEGYEVPKSVGGGNYMKLEDGQNKFRVLTPAVVGYEYWNQENKCIRSPKPFPSVPADIRLGRDGKQERVKHFWAFAVFNHKVETVQILEITQQTIQSQINDYYVLEEYGDPMGYDINITRKGEGLDTEYTVQAFPPKPMSQAARQAFEARKINLNALFDGGNPFEESETAMAEKHYTEMASAPAPVSPGRPRSLGGKR